MLLLLQVVRQRRGRRGLVVRLLGRREGGARAEELRQLQRLCDRGWQRARGGRRWCGRRWSSSSQ